MLRLIILTHAARIVELEGSPYRQFYGAHAPAEYLSRTVEAKSGVWTPEGKRHFIVRCIEAGWWSKREGFQNIVLNDDEIASLGKHFPCIANKDPEELLPINLGLLMERAYPEIAKQVNLKPVSEVRFRGFPSASYYAGRSDKLLNKSRLIEFLKLGAAWEKRNSTLDYGISPKSDVYKFFASNLATRPAKSGMVGYSCTSLLAATRSSRAAPRRQ